MQPLSLAARRLWAKKARAGEADWLPLAAHLEDSAALAKRLWRTWLSEGVKRTVESGCACGEGEAEKLFVFIMAAHDIGKALPVFQAKPSGFKACDLDERLTEALIAAGLAMQPYAAFTNAAGSRHGLAGQVILEAAGCTRNVAAIIGAHHGRPASYTELDEGREECMMGNFCVRKSGRPAWDAVRAELVAFALATAGYASFDEMPTPDVSAQVLLCGLAIMTDWIASNEASFPYIGIDDEVSVGLGEKRAEAAFRGLDFLKTPWQPGNWSASLAGFRERFGFSPRPLQTAAIEAASGIAAPGIFIVEAPMGVGKTEIALAAAEIFAAHAERSGVFFALPTQATSDGMFPRMLRWIAGLGDGIHSVELVHAKAQFNDDFSAVMRMENGSGIAQDDADGAAVSPWFAGRKKALLADFAVGTVDQLLQLALKQKHGMLRHLALANKVVVIDECHAYDAYMNVYLKRALRWLGRYKTPVILLSATLPRAKRQELMRAYLCSDKACGRADTPDGLPDATAYPLITYSQGDQIFYKPIADGMQRVVLDVAALADSAIVQTLDVLLEAGGCAGVIVNTVGRAQSIAQTLRAYFGGDTVRLLHSRFIAADRLAKERALRCELGKSDSDEMRPYRQIVVGTQVIEQSLDLDFDVMLTDLCPVDLLLQRMGRLHRHSRPRPPKLAAARCFVLGMQTDGFDAGAVRVYGAYLLMRTKALLPPRIILPDDISALVQAVYEDGRNALPAVPEGYDAAREEWEKRLKAKESKAKTFRIDPPWNGIDNDITGWLDTQVSDAAGEAAVRDGEDFLEAIAVRLDDDGTLHLLSDGCALPETLPDYAVAKRIAQESLRLPAVLCKPYMVDGVIAELEARAAAKMPLWQNSPWLKGCLFLLFNAENVACLSGYRLKYDGFYGLTCEKEDGMDG